MMLVLALAAVFGMCISLFNYWFQKDRYRRMSKEEIQRLNLMNSPGAWLIYFFIFFLSILGIIGYYIYKYFLAVMQMAQ